MSDDRFKAALEEIVSGVYATGRNPRDIAKRVLDGAVPVQLQALPCNGYPSGFIRCAKGSVGCSRHPADQVSRVDPVKP